MFGIGCGCFDKTNGSRNNCQCQAKCAGCKNAQNTCQSLGNSSDCDGCKKGLCDECYSRVRYFTLFGASLLLILVTISFIIYLIKTDAVYSPSIVASNLKSALKLS